MLKIRSIRFGGHSLSVCFSITNLADLEAAMKAVADRGGRIFEMPFLLCKLAWKDVAEAAIRAGIKEISFCHFWPKDKNGNPVCGDPLGNEEQ
ncbi:MAG TPA: hypothetical protein VEC13_01320, partial [Candidatus Paceibacterota bacterium]|nr:hypothetical protein [Candidatus Paceibacterota bacterium]